MQSIGLNYREWAAVGFVVCSAILIIMILIGCGVICRVAVNLIDGLSGSLVAVLVN
jgi:hypothetical protein